MSALTIFFWTIIWRLNFATSKDVFSERMGASTRTVLPERTSSHSCLEPISTTATERPTSSLSVQLSTISCRATNRFRTWILSMMKSKSRGDSYPVSSLRWILSWWTAWPISAGPENIIRPRRSCRIWDLTIYVLWKSCEKGSNAPGKPVRHWVSGEEKSHGW